MADIQTANIALQLIDLAKYVAGGTIGLAGGLLVAFFNNRHAFKIKQLEIETSRQRELRASGRAMARKTMTRIYTLVHGAHAFSFAVRSGFKHLPKDIRFEDIIWKVTENLQFIGFDLMTHFPAIAEKYEEPMRAIFDYFYLWNEIAPKSGESIELTESQKAELDRIKFAKAVSTLYTELVEDLAKASAL